jgi:hypothetical protein
MGNCSSAKGPIRNSIRVSNVACSSNLLHQHSIANRKHAAQNLSFVDQNNDQNEIQSIQIFFGEYVKGIQVCYSGDSQVKKLDLMGSGSYDQTYTLTLGESEYIDSLGLYYDDVAVFAISVTTTAGQKVFIGNDKKNLYKKEINLQNSGQVITGFRGLVGEYLKDLNVYFEELDNTDELETVVA